MIYLPSFLALALAFGTMHAMSRPQLAACAAGAFLGLFAAMRGPEVASDFLNYQEWYEVGLDDNFIPRPPYVEALYFGLSEMLSESGLPFRAFLFGVASVPIYVKARILLKFSSTPAASAIGLLVFALTFYLLHD